MANKRRGRGTLKGTNGGGGMIKGQHRGETRAQAMERMGATKAYEAAVKAVREAGAAPGGTAPTAPVVEVPPPRETPRTSGKKANVKLAVEVMSEAMNYFFGLAALYQPSEGNTHANEPKFEKYLGKSADVAGKLAPYQSQRLETTTVIQVPMDLGRLTIEELAQLEHLHAKAAVIEGNPGGDSATIN